LVLFLQKKNFFLLSFEKVVDASIRWHDVGGPVFCLGLS